MQHDQNGEASIGRRARCVEQSELVAKIKIGDRLVEKQACRSLTDRPASICASA